MPAGGGANFIDETVLLEMQGADVDGDGQVPGGIHFFPGLDLGAGCFQHPAPDGHDESNLLGKRNELQRRNQPALGMHPSDQGFDTDRAGLVIHLKLVEQPELPVRHCLAQRRLQRDSCIQCLLHQRVEESLRVAPRLLGLIHGHVGLGGQIFAPALVAMEQRDTDAGGSMMLVAFEQVGFIERSKNLVAHHLGMDDGAVRSVVEVIEQHDELVPTQTSHGIFFAHSGFQPCSDFAQQEVAIVVAFGVVEMLEIIEIQIQHCAVLAATLARREGMLQPVGQ
ncbi:hypothetical protein GALL_461540 [mine drainage metagenome]|uniref:Uncharacterized protein n=1 Tax=mine drainage metagenome TaxID=410659 RepID=A0A1J5PN42_9ZZZZ